jgi:hypothetical protein
VLARKDLLEGLDSLSQRDELALETGEDLGNLVSKRVNTPQERCKKKGHVRRKAGS